MVRSEAREYLGEVQRGHRRGDGSQNLRLRPLFRILPFSHSDRVLRQSRLLRPGDDY